MDRQRAIDIAIYAINTLLDPAVSKLDLNDDDLTLAAKTLHGVGQAEPGVEAKGHLSKGDKGCPLCGSTNLSHDFFELFYNTLDYNATDGLWEAGEGAEPGDFSKDASIYCNGCNSQLSFDPEIISWP